MTSNIKTFFLLMVLTALLLILGGALGGKAGLMIALVLAVVMNFASYWYSDKIVLKMYKARELAPEDAPQLHAMVAEMAHRAGIPKPRIAIIPQQQPNAFATGRDPEHAVVAVTDGIMRLLPHDELKAVLAHELGHVVNRDILIQSVSAVLASAVMTIANMLQWAAIFGFSSDDEEGGMNPLAAIAFAILAPIAASLVQMAISRSREYLADETGARLCGNPMALASALMRLESAARQIPMQGNPVTENMFIVNPFTGQNMARLFSTHPSTEERVARLRNMGGGY
ncbi:MAG: zinc metalloprotease HtpX [Desulfovibrio sp.]